MRDKTVLPITTVRKKQPDPGLLVVVSKFEPDPKDTTDVVVELKVGDAAPVLLGRFSIFPHAKFAAPTPDKAQRFRLKLTPDNAKLIAEGGAVTVRLEALRAGAAAPTASIELGPATLELPESEASPKP